MLFFFGNWNIFCLNLFFFNCLFLFFFKGVVYFFDVLKVIGDNNVDIYIFVINILFFFFFDIICVFCFFFR